jgi:hypothetical protein
MIGLEFVMGGLLQMAAIGGCAKQKPPNILAEPLTSVVQYDFTKSRGDLQNFDIDTVSPYGPEHRAKVGGLMSGEIRVESRIRFMQEKYAARGAGCVHVDSIDIIVHVDPTIYVASEYAKGTCQHAAIIEHEKKHVQADIAVARKYAALLKTKLAAYLRQVDYTHGPYPIERIEAAQARIQENIQNLVKANNEGMTNERKNVQQQLDSLAEYERVAAQCKGGLMPNDGTAPNRQKQSAPRPHRFNQ